MEWYNDKYTLLIDGFDVNEWQHIQDSLSIEPNAEIWQTHKISSYRYNIVLKMARTSVHLAYWHNTQVSTNMGLHSLRIEFNFKKCRGEKLFDWLCEVLFYPHLTDLRISRVDMCTDITNPISSFIVDKGRKKNTRSYNDTLYFGDRGRNGAVKIYDKAKEMGTDDVLTRYEVTIHPKCLSGCMKLLDSQFLSQYSLVEVMIFDTWQLGIELDPVDRMVITSIMNGDGYLNELNRRYRKKIKDIMDKMTSLKIDESSVLDINTAIVSEKQFLIDYISMIHNQFQFGKIEVMPF